MSNWQESDFRSRSETGAPLLLLGAILGLGAAFLLKTPQGKVLKDQFFVRVGEWQETAADYLAQGRESLITAVESEFSSSESDSFQVREKKR